LKTLFAFTKLI